MPAISAALWSLPWIIPPLVAVVRARRSRSLDDVTDVAPDAAPLVSVIVPARNERRNIERCVASLLASRYPDFEVIVVDDQSSDGTGEVARAMAAHDARLRVVAAEARPTGWFGKQWACATGAGLARGAVLLFTDADTCHSPDLLPRAVNAFLDARIDLLTVAGHQEMLTFWERVVQPHVFALLSLRYGGTENVSRATRPVDAIANGQFMLMRRDVYDAIGGHASVRDRVAEDLAIAQEIVRTGRRLLFILGIRQLSTRMYASLAELVAGWRKNIYAGGRYAMRGGALGRAVFPGLLIAYPAAGLVPPVALALAIAGVLSPAWLLWSGLIVAITLLFWAATYRFAGVGVAYALLYPLGSIVLLFIAVTAVARGNRVAWKGRTYTSG